MLLQTTFDSALDEEIRVKTLSGTLTEDEKAWIATYNSLWVIMGDLTNAIREEFGEGALTEIQETNDVS